MQREKEEKKIQMLNYKCPVIVKQACVCVCGRMFRMQKEFLNCVRKGKCSLNKLIFSQESYLDLQLSLHCIYIVKFKDELALCFEG